jgi:hypothetical protein
MHQWNDDPIPRAVARFRKADAEVQTKERRELHLPSFPRELHLPAFPMSIRTVPASARRRLLQLVRRAMVLPTAPI